MTRFQKILFLSSGLLVCLLFLLTQLNAHFRGYGFSDWGAWLDSVGEHPQTRYTAGFTETRFALIKPGMSHSEVERLLGTPFEKIHWSPIAELWSYSESVTNVPNYHRR